MSQELLRSFFHAYAHGDEQAIDRLCTPSMALVAKAGIAESTSRFGGVCGLAILSSLAPPVIVRHRTYNPTPAVMRQISDPMYWAQLTVRLTTKQVPTFIARGRAAVRRIADASAVSSPTASPTASSSSPSQQQQPHHHSLQVRRTQRSESVTTNSSASSTGVRSAHLPSSAGQWVPAVDESSGHVYYFHAGTGQALWEAPSSLGVIDTTLPLRMTDLGVQRRPHIGVAPVGVDDEAVRAAQGGGVGGSPAASDPASPMEVVNFVVWEHAMTSNTAATPDEKRWRIAGMM